MNSTRSPFRRTLLFAVPFLTVVACGGNPEVGDPDDDVPGGFDGGMMPGPVTGGDGGGVGPGPILSDDDVEPPPEVCNPSTGENCDPDDFVLVDAGPACGDAVVDRGEECDDGNSVPGDGCNGACQEEPYYICDEPGKPCTFTIECGDGQVDPGEVCDDGNLDEDDGCSSTCEQDPDYICPAPNEPCELVYSCGDGVVNGSENCDDGNADPDDGCDADCQTEDGYVCATPGSDCAVIEYCGDGVQQTGEACDDGDVVRDDPVVWSDGCSGVCTVDPFYSCPEAGEPCMSLIICGDGIRHPGEACDDGDTATPNDGCSEDCKTVEPGFVCPPGAACVQLYRCGDGRVSSATGETCDDGGTADTDGCSSTCQIENGWTCPIPGQPCQPVTFCGDGTRQGSEQCDDGGNDPGDGCSAQCRVEKDWICDVNGQICTYNVVCGDGVVNGDEACDTGTAPSLGCIDCTTVDDGYTCPRGGFACRTVCGDGIIAGAEQCDDSGITPGDGCDAYCRMEPNTVCTGEPSTCTDTVCGNGGPGIPREGTELCDDGNFEPLDGCAPDCTLEPSCGWNAGMTTYGCNDVCGDGMKFPGEQCDDGNLSDGDGCSSLCVIEDGYQCPVQTVTDTQPCASDATETCLVLPIVYRDFRGHDGGTCEAPAPKQTLPHPQFGIDGGGGYWFNITTTALGADGKPVYNTSFVGNTMNGAQPIHTCAATLSAAQSAAAFAQWYTDDAVPNSTAATAANYNWRLDSTLELQYNATADAYEFYDDTFFPLDGMGFGNVTQAGNTHNYYFTSEMRYWFYYQGGEQFEFRGDDDVWVYVNGQRVIDLGGIHGERLGTVTLNGATSQVCIGNQNEPTTAGQRTCTTVDIPLIAGNVYEIALFQAERHVTGSNYKLTLKNFIKQRSVCTPVCGDGVITSTEECDDAGDNTSTPTYDSCTQGACPGPDCCTLGPFCGDDIVTAPQETCDNADNRDGWGDTGMDLCAPGCQNVPECGDGNVDSPYEECDDGVANTDTGYEGCTTSCQLGPYCGDGAVNGAETCDDGINDGRYGGCTPDCAPAPRCGDDVVQEDWGEECDSPTNCTALCRLVCGNGVVDAGEECDDGVNDGSYSYCAPGCVWGPRCGDGTIDAPFETCDEGPTGNDGGYDECSPFCQPDEYCGDGVVNGDEQCDNRINSGGYNSCAPGCVLGPHCGDGVVQAEWGEQCDGGANCADNCRLVGSCGDGVRQANLGEECDDGVNDGGWGECGPMCTEGPRCGDGVVQPQDEQCDDGDNDGGYGECAVGCRLGPRCGDGTVNGPEQCDDGNSKSGDGCNATCLRERMAGAR